LSIFSRLRKAVSGIDNPFARFILFGLSKNALWTPADYASLSKAGYENCMAVYSCVNLIARSAAGIEWTAKVREKDAPEHKILNLLNRPNDTEGRRAFITKAFSFFLLSGNRYVVAGRIGTQPPLALWVPRPDRMKVLPGTRGQLVGGYEYRVSSEPLTFEPGQVLHSKLFHPTDDFYGLSPLSVASHAVDISNMSSEWNMRLLQNDMRPPGALSAETPLNDTQFKRLKTMMEQEWSGYANAGKPLLLEGGLKWVNFMLTAKEMDWLNTTKFNRRDICTVFNVDPCLVGDSEYATYSNKIEARKGLYEDTVIPLMDEFADDLNFWLSPMFGEGVVLAVNKDKIPALQENREKLYTYLAGAWWLRLDELRKATGQDEIGGPLGETIFVPIGKIPLEDAVAPPEPIEPEPGPEPDPEADAEEEPKARKATKGLWSAPEKKRALWDNFIARVKAKERGLLADAEAFLARQNKDIITKARSAGSPADLRAESLVDLEKENAAFAGKFRARYRWLFKTAGTAGMRLSSGKLYDFEEESKGDPTFDLTAEHKKLIEKLLAESAKWINEETVKEIGRFLTAFDAERYTVEEITQGLKEKLEELSIARARRIARTETGKVENAGQIEGYRQIGFVDRKGWLCSFVEDSREAHMEADGQEVALDEDFKVGSEILAYPGDPGGDAGNVVNCLCTTYPVVGE
jgi:HK97 family phage portal protein